MSPLYSIVKPIASLRDIPDRKHADLEEVEADPILAGGDQFGAGAMAARPAAGREGRWFYVDDAEPDPALRDKLYRDTGAAWQEVLERDAATFPTVHKIKAADQAVNNSTVMVADDTLRFPVAPNEVWIWQAYIHTGDGGVPQADADIKYAWAFPTGTVGSWGAIGSDGSAGGNRYGPTLGTVVAKATLNNDRVAHLLFGRASIGAAAGEIVLQFAQNVAQLINTSVRAGSYLMASRVA